ncbi:DUF4232 domain-containing protein [Streptomyces sp. NBC_00344]|uniref:DUF4232 domain-containing protein n=1 Tax=Streptomyces sp. NBC_00344 TaxID=2975720 RepID=UPI002E2157C8
MNVRRTRIATAAASTLVAALALTGLSSTGATAAPAKAKASKRLTCVGDNTKVTVSKVSRPVNHLLVKITNTGTRNCDAYYAPTVSFDNDTWHAKIIKDSMPQAVVTLAPGESGYASLGLSGDGTGHHRHKASHATLSFSAIGGGSTHTVPDELELPAGTVVDDGAYVSYWQYTAADALIW